MATPAFSKVFQPRADLGDIVLLLGQTDFASRDGHSCFEVVGIEGLTLLGQHGAIVVWSQAAAAPAGYVLDQNASSGSIASLGQSSTQPLNSLKNAPDELTQVRFLFKFLGTLPAPPVVDDLDVQLAQPGSTRRWSVANANGVLNMMAQAQLPGDTIVLPAQGANLGLPSAYPQIDPFETGMAQRSELNIWRDQSPAVTVINNGSATLGGSTDAVALMVGGFKYKLRPITEFPEVTRQILGLSVQAPQFLSEQDLRGLTIFQLSAR